MTTLEQGRSFGLSWTILVQPGLTTVAVTGELDLASAPALEGVLLEALDATPVLVIDLEKLEFMDSTGLRLLGRTHQASDQLGKRFLLGRASHPVRRVLHLAGLVEFFDYAEGAPAHERLCRTCDEWIAGDPAICPSCGSSLSDD